MIASLGESERHPVDLDSPEPQTEAFRSRLGVLVSEPTDDFLRASARNEDHLRRLRAL